MMLHRTRGEYQVLLYGLLEIHGMMFADDGFGNFIRVDVKQAVHSVKP